MFSVGVMDLFFWVVVVEVWNFDLYIDNLKFKDKIICFLNRLLDFFVVLFIIVIDFIIILD